MKKLQLKENDSKGFDLVIDETTISTSNHIESYAFFQDLEREANRAMFRLEQIHPKKQFNFSLQSMMVTDEQRQAALLKHLTEKHPHFNMPMLISTIEDEIAKIQIEGPDDNHPNPFLKFPIASDFIKVFIASCVDSYITKVTQDALANDEDEANHLS